jgi:hypothetical protein
MTLKKAKVRKITTEDKYMCGRLDDSCDRLTNDRGSCGRSSGGCGRGGC